MVNKGSQVVKAMSKIKSQINDLQDQHQVVVEQREFLSKINDLQLSEAREEHLTCKIIELHEKWLMMHDYFMSKCDF